MAIVQTTITNTSGATRRFTWLLPHGAELANGGTKTVLGCIESRFPHERDRTQFAADVAASNVSVTHTGLS